MNDKKDIEERLEALVGVVARLHETVDLLRKVVQGEEPEERDERLKAVEQQIQRGYGDSQAVHQSRTGD